MSPQAYIVVEYMRSWAYTLVEYTKMEGNENDTIRPW